MFRRRNEVTDGKEVLFTISVSHTTVRSAAVHLGLLMVYGEPWSTFSLVERSDMLTRTFSRRHVSRTHIEMKDRPHGCNHPGCNKRFNCPREVQRHKATHQRDTPKIPCPYCSHPGFTRDDNLQRHVKSSHLQGSDSGYGGALTSPTSSSSGIPMSRRTSSSSRLSQPY